MLLTGIYLVNAQCSPHMSVITNPRHSDGAGSSRKDNKVRQSMYRL